MANMIKTESTAVHVEKDFGLQEVQVRLFEDLSLEEMNALEKTLVRKIDFHLIASLFLLFIFNILDRSNIASARLAGLQEDLKLTDTEYQTAVSLMFVGYLLGQIPSNIALTRAKPSRYMPVAIIVWGTISLCTAAVKTKGGLLAIRTLLGFAESPFFPGALLLVSSWYKPTEIAPRIAFLYCGNTVANGFGGLLAAGILGGLDGVRGLTGWRWLYIIEGAGTMVAGLLAYLLLPDFPRSGQRKWLSEQEQRFAEWRLAGAANDEIDENGPIKQGLKDALTDYKTWMLVLVQVCLLTTQCWTYFFPSIVKTLGYDTIITLVLTAPVYCWGFLASVSNALIASRTNQRAIFIIWPFFIDIAGNIMVMASHAKAVRYLGMFFMCMGSFSAFNIVHAWVASTIPRTRTKRAVVYALVNLFGNSSNIYGSYLFPTSDEPQYRKGLIILTAFAVVGIFLTSMLALMLKRLNKKASEAEKQDEVSRYKYLW